MRVFARAHRRRRWEVLEALRNIVDMVGRDADVVNEVVLPESVSAEDALGLLRASFGERNGRSV